MRSLRVKRFHASAVLALSLFGCSSVSSSNLKTAGLRADLGVTANGAGDTVVTAEFRVDGAALTYVALQSGDRVTAAASGQTQTLQESTLLGTTAYAASFSGADAEGTTYRIALERDADTSAPNSTATLPAKFAITSPTGTSLSYSRANDDLVVTYDNAGTSDAMSCTVSGICINTTVLAFTSDSGTLTIPKGSIVQAGTSSGATTCQVTLTVYRTRLGTLDPAFAGGTVRASQARTIAFTSTP